MYRVWYSTESFADYIIDKTSLKKYQHDKKKLYESDANNPKLFHTMPDHIRKILYLDAPDLIIEKDNEPVLSIEVTTEAGTGHNAFQRYARLVAAVENNVPAFYIYPEGKIIARENRKTEKSTYGWDVINPLVFRSLEAVMSIYSIPALLYYFPTDDITKYRDDPTTAPNFSNGGLCFEKAVKYAACPESNADSMKKMLEAISLIIDKTEKMGVATARNNLLKETIIRDQRNYMQEEFVIKEKESKAESEDEMSPLSAVEIVPSEYLVNYLHKYETKNYHIGDLLRNREKTYLYQIDAKFRGDPYTGALAAIDYLKCRTGATFEDRQYNLVMVWGKVVRDDENKTFSIKNSKGTSIGDFFTDVKSCSKKNLLVKDYNDLENYEIPRYFMQVRYGSTYSKVKHIRVYSYFADAILFADGALWRDA